MQIDQVNLIPNAERSILINNILQRCEVEKFHQFCRVCYCIRLDERIESEMGENHGNS
jgi:hypothetical protein